jgi:flagellar hook-basal body complex protein FliE
MSGPINPTGSIPTLTVTAPRVTPAGAAAAYDAASGVGAAGGGDFGTALSRAVQDGLQGALDAGRTADVAATNGIEGRGNLTQVVTAVSNAELALQSTVAIRDRVVSAYQQIMQMPI